jgi:hypothetical protein
MRLKMATTKTYQSKRQQHGNLVRWRKGRELFRAYSSELKNEFPPDIIDKACRFIAGLENAGSRQLVFLKYSRRAERLSETQRAIFAILSRHRPLLRGKRAGDDWQLDRLRREKLEAKDYKEYLLLFEGSECFRSLLSIEHLLPDRDYWRCLKLVWDKTSWTTRDQGEWLRLLKSTRPHREFLMSVDERRALAAMPETLSIYQGYAKDWPRKGLEWTLSKEAAISSGFSESGRWDRPPSIAMIANGKCFKRDVIAYHSVWEEIVIDPRKVTVERATVLTESDKRKLVYGREESVIKERQTTKRAPRITIV